MRALRNTSINSCTLYPHRAGVRLQRGGVPSRTGGRRGFRLQSGRTCRLGCGKLAGRAHPKPTVIPADIARTLRGDRQNRPDCICETHCLAAAQSISQALQAGANDCASDRNLAEFYGSGCGKLWTGPTVSHTSAPQTLKNAPRRLTTQATLHLRI